MLGAGDKKLGKYTLRPEQVAAVGRILASFDAHGGALLADPPGSGKTIVALAVARRAREASDADPACMPAVLVVAPAALRAQWERSAARAAMPMCFISFEALSQGAQSSLGPGRVIVIDEAHHARTTGTRRYARLAELCTGSRVLLLSATPVVNRAADRDALLALFLGGRAAVMPAGAVPCIIRREESRFDLPVVRRLPPLRVPSSDAGPRIAALIGSLPPPLPAVDGTAALALIRITLAMAWSSSLAALDASLRRRIQRGEALADSLAAGSWPTRAALRQWVMGDDATQLAFPALDSQHGPPDGGAERLLRAHIDAVRALRCAVRPCMEGDTAARAAALEALQRARPAERVVVFARHAQTVRALWSALRARGGVVAVLGERVLAAEGRWTRDEVLAALGPRGSALRAGDARMIRILLATDLLSEGVEMQGAGIVVHADRAWTPATMEQREGRVARPGSRCPEVLVTRFIAPASAAPLLRLGRRLAAKDRARHRALRDARCAEAIDRAFGAWTDPASATTANEPSDAFLAAVRDPRHGERVIAGRLMRGRWRLATSACAVARIARLDREVPLSESNDVLPGIRRSIASWLRREATDSLIGALESPRAQERPRRADCWRAARMLVDRTLAGSSFVERAARAAAFTRSLSSLERTAGAGTERRLRELVREARSGRFGAAAFERELHSLAAAASRADEPGTSTHGVPRRPTLLALVLLSSARAPLPRVPVPSPPSASP